MAHVFVPSIGRRYEWRCAPDGSPAVKAPDWSTTNPHMVNVGTPMLDIPYSAGHDGFIASSYWVEHKVLGGKGSAAAGTFSMTVFPGWNGNDKSDLLSLECLGPDGTPWEIVVDVNGNVVTDWGRGLGIWQLP